MSDYQISLSEDVYCRLLAVANSSGMNPADWLAAQLATVTELPPSDSIWDLIGAINSQEEPAQSYDENPFGEAIAAKLAEQGIQRP